MTQNFDRMLTVEFIIRHALPALHFLASLMGTVYFSTKLNKTQIFM